MHIHEAWTADLDRPHDEAAVRHWALERLSSVVGLERELAALPALDRPVPLPLLRRAVFAAWRDAVDAGVGDAALSLVADAARTGV